MLCVVWGRACGVEMRVLSAAQRRGWRITGWWCGDVCRACYEVESPAPRKTICQEKKGDEEEDEKHRENGVFACVRVRFPSGYCDSLSVRMGFFTHTLRGRVRLCERATWRCRAHTSSH